MDQDAFADTVKRLHEADEVIKKLDPAIRAEAFGILKPYVTAGALTDDEDTFEEDEKPKRKKPAGQLDLDALVEEHESDKDHENALLALAVYYARHGKGPFEMSALKDIADELKLTIPNRTDTFFKGHKRNGREVLRKQTDGWKIMPSGETWLKETYGVTKGKTPVGDD